MSALLFVKVVRDMRRSLAQQVSLGVMVTLGVAFLVGAYSVYENLEASYAASYNRLSFEDFSVRFNSAPRRVIERVAEVPGVLAVEGRAVRECSMRVPSKPGAKMVSRLIEVPTSRSLRVNRLRTKAGIGPTSGLGSRVLLEANFAEYHKIEPGSTLELDRDGETYPVEVAGVVQSDEYLYVVRSQQDLISMPDTFGVLFVSEALITRLFGRRGEINELHVRVDQPSARNAAMLGVQHALRAYEPEMPVPREDQPSYQMLRQDVEGFRSYSILFPMLFLGVAMVTVASMMTRSVHAQRPVIGVLRSLGLSKRAILVHFMAAPFVVGLAAGVAGAGFGFWMGAALSVFYMSQLQVPYQEIVPRYPVVATGMATAVLVCLASAFRPARQAAETPAAEAMRPVTPSFGRHSIRLDRIIPGLGLLAQIPMRNLFRQPLRTGTTLLGIIGAMCLLVTARGLLDSMDAALSGLMRSLFGYDVRADFLEVQSRRLATSMRTWPGVRWSEGVLELPVDLQRGGATYSALLNGVERGSRLRTLVDANGREVAIPSSGLIVGPTIRNRLRLRLGDVVSVSLPERFTPERSRSIAMQVAGFNDEAIGTQAYMERGEMERRFRSELGLPGNAVTSIIMKIDPAHAADVRRRILDTPNSGSATMQVTMSSMIARLLEASRWYVVIMEAFGAVLALAAVFNMVTINVLERMSEFATLRTIGVSYRQMARLVVVENLMIGVVGILIGTPVSHGFVHLFWKSAQTEEQQDLFTFNVSVLPGTFAWAGIAVLCIVLVAAIPSLRLLKKIDLPRAIKERST